MRSDRPGVFLTDFGLARNVATGSRYTRTGETLGTPAYMSPEQARGDFAALTPASDVWGLGCVLFEALTGRPAFEGDTAAAVIANVVMGRHVPLRTLGSSLPRDVGTAIDRCLRRAPAARPPNAAALARALRALLDGRRPSYPAARRRPVVALGVLALGTLIGLAAWHVAARDIASLGPTGRPGDAEALAVEARTVQEGDPARAVDLLGRALEADPGRSDWRIERGLILWGQGRVDAALADWTAVPAASEHGPTAALYEGIARYLGGDAADRPEADGDAATRAGRRAEGRRARARPAFDRAAHARDRVGRLAAAWLRFLEGDPAAALAGLRELPGWEVPLLRCLAATHSPKPDWEAAARDYTEGIRVAPRVARLRQLRGVARTVLQDHDGAEADLQEALRLDPADHESWQALAVVHWVQKRRETAVGDLDRALALVPDEPRFLAYRAQMLQELGRNDDALADLDRAIAQQPDYPEARARRAAIRGTRGQYADALADLEVALRHAPRDPYSHVQRADYLAKLGRVSEAVEAARAAVAAAPQLADARSILATALASVGRFDEALAEFERAVALDPENTRLRMDRARCHFHRQDWPRMRADLDVAVARDPALVEARSLRGIARFEAGDVAGAADDYRAALALKPDDVSVWGRLGQACQELARWDEAAAAYRRALALGPPADWVGTIRQALAACEARASGG